MNKEPEKAVDIWERLEGLREALVSGDLAAKTVHEAKLHFIERIDSILRNYPRQHGFNETIEGAARIFEAAYSKYDEPLMGVVCGLKAIRALKKKV